MHFSPEKNGFLKYHSLSTKDRIHVYMVSGVLYVTGKGTCAICWLDENYCLHILKLYNVGNISNLRVCLISLGQLMFAGAKIHGDLHQIDLLFGDGELLAPFFPGRMRHNMHIIEHIPSASASASTQSAHALSLWSPFQGSTQTCAKIYVQFS